MKTGIELIAEERDRQISAEGWTPEHDNGHTNGELAAAAASYALASWSRTTAEEMWPWGREEYKPQPDNGHATHEERIRNFTRAGALLAAEIDRLQRVKSALGEEGAK